MFALMNEDLTINRLTDGTQPINWRNMSLPPPRMMTVEERVANFIYDYVAATEAPPYHSDTGVEYQVGVNVVTEVRTSAPWSWEKLQEYKSQCKSKIDTLADTARMKYVSVGVYTQQEYLQAETDAKAFIADPLMVCPLSVSCWAQSNPGWTNIQAATDIATTALQFRGLLDQIRSIRLIGKSNITQSTTGADVDLAMSQVATQFTQLP